MIDPYFSANHGDDTAALGAVSGASGVLQPLKLSYRLGQTSIETYTNAQALLLVTITAPGLSNGAPKEFAASEITLHVSPDASVREMTVLSHYQVTDGPAGLTVHCGNLLAGEERYILLRLRCGSGAGPQPLAELSLRYGVPGGVDRSATKAFVAIERANEAYVPPMDAVVARKFAMIKSAAAGYGRKPSEFERGTAPRPHPDAFVTLAGMERERMRANARRTQGGRLLS